MCRKGVEMTLNFLPKICNMWQFTSILLLVMLTSNDDNVQCEMWNSTFYCKCFIYFIYFIGDIYMARYERDSKDFVTMNHQ